MLSEGPVKQHLHHNKHTAKGEGKTVLETLHSNNPTSNIPDFFDSFFSSSLSYYQVSCLRQPELNKNKR